MKILAAALTLSFSALPAQAILVGQGITTLDTVSNLEWLDLSESTSFSFAQVASQLGPNGRYAGYRFATASEVADVLRQVGFPIVSYTELPRGSLAGALTKFDALFGSNTGVRSTLSGFTAIVGDAPYVPGYRPIVYAFDSNLNTAITTGISGGGAVVSFNEVDVGLGENYLPAYPVGSFLVRAVPEPGTHALILAGLGAIGALGARRRLGSAVSTSTPRPAAKPRG